MLAIADGPLSLDEAAQMVHKMAEAVVYAQGKGVIRDLKSSNILIDKRVPTELAGAVTF